MKLGILAGASGSPPDNEVVRPTGISLAVSTLPAGRCPACGPRRGNPQSWNLTSGSKRRVHALLEREEK
jgi:hypothetical protein